MNNICINFHFGGEKSQSNALVFATTVIKGKITSIRTSFPGRQAKYIFGIFPNINETQLRNA